MGIFSIEPEIKSPFFIFRKTLMILFGDYDGIFFIDTSTDLHHNEDN